MHTTHLKQKAKKNHFRHKIVFYFVITEVKDIQLKISFNLKYNTLYKYSRRKNNNKRLNKHLLLKRDH